MPNEDEENLVTRITTRADVFGGQPIIRDMRISVRLILSLLAQGESWDELLADYPALERDDIRACLAFAAQVTGERRDQVLPATAGSK